MLENIDDFTWLNQHSAKTEGFNSEFLKLDKERLNRINKVDNKYMQDFDKKTEQKYQYDEFVDLQNAQETARAEGTDGYIDEGKDIIDKITDDAKATLDSAVQEAEDTLTKAGDELVESVKEHTNEAVNEAVDSMRDEAEKGMKSLKLMLSNFFKDFFK
jgi:vacuolar-type H+-ATPase subunit H